MNRQLGALAVTLGLALGGQEALASDEPIKLRNPTVGHTTEEVRGDVQNCIGKGLIKLPDGECAIMVDLVDKSPIITSPIKEEIAQLQKRGKEMHKKDLVQLWGGVAGIILLFGGLISLLSKNSRNLDDEQSLNELLEELKDNFASINENYPDWFLRINNIEIAEIKDELSSGIKQLKKIISEINQEDTKESIEEKKLIISKLEKLKKKTEALDKKFTKTNRDYQNREKIEESFR